MGNPRFFKLDVAIKELNRRQEALDLAKNLSGLSKEARALYEARLELMGISVARLQRFIESEGTRGQFGNPREYTARMISGGTEGHVDYRFWPGEGFNWNILSPHHGGGGLWVQEAIGLLPPWKQYAVLQELEASGRFPGQQQGKGMYGLIVSQHVGNPSPTGKKGLDPTDFGTPGQSAHGMPLKKLVLNPNASITDLVKQISAHMDEYDALNDAKLKESNRILSVIKELPQDQQVRALRETFDNPGALKGIYEAVGGEVTKKTVGFTPDGEAIIETTTNDGSKVYHQINPNLSGKPAFSWLSPANALKVAAGTGLAGLTSLVNPETGEAAGRIAKDVTQGEPVKPSDVKDAGMGAIKDLGWSTGYALAGKALLRGGAGKVAGGVLGGPVGWGLLGYGAYEAADAFSQGLTGKQLHTNIDEATKPQQAAIGQAAYEADQFIRDNVETVKEQIKRHTIDYWTQLTEKR